MYLVTIHYVLIILLFTPKHFDIELNKLIKLLMRNNILPYILRRPIKETDALGLGLTLLFSVYFLQFKED